MRVGEGRVRDEAAAAAAVRASDQDLEEEPVIVPAGVCELRAAGDVADGVHARRAGPVFVVRHDEAFSVEADARLVAAEIVGVGVAADRDQQMRAA